MVSIRFTSFVLVLMFILLHGRDSFAHTPQDGNEPAAARGSPAVIVEKEIYGGVPPAPIGVMNIRQLGGRKMISKRALGEEMVKEEGLNGEASKITGNDGNALKKLLGTSQEHMNDQTDRSQLTAKSLNSTSLETSGKRPADLPNTNPPCSQDSKLVSNRDSLKCSYRSKKAVPQKSDDPFQNLYSQKLLEAANEMVNLMNKDYQGAGNPGQSKPPINNDEPLNQEHVTP